MANAWFILLGAIAAVTVSISPATAQTSVPVFTRLKPADAEVRRLVTDGYGRSAVMTDLVNRLEASDAIVVIQFGRCADGRVRSCVSNVSSDGRTRHIRIRVNPRTTDDRLIATIAHELQHATEIVSSPETVDAKTTLALYRRIGTRDCKTGLTDKCETEAAVQVEAIVNRELGRRD